jgi:hypothetical protein
MYFSAINTQERNSIVSRRECGSLYLSRDKAWVIGITFKRVAPSFMGHFACADRYTEETGRGDVEVEQVASGSPIRNVGLVSAVRVAVLNIRLDSTAGWTC